MKKLISLVLAVTMIISLVPTFAFATEAEPQTSNIITLFDFGDPATFGTANYSKKPSSPSALSYEGKESSLRWEMQMTSSAEGWITSPELDMTYSATDLSALSEDSVINVRFYSDAVGSKFNLVYFCNDGIGNDADGVLRSTQNAVTIVGGWQVYSLPLKTILDKYNTYTDDLTFKIRFNDEGWSNMKNNGYKDGDTIYIDEIWVDTDGDDESYYTALEADASNKVLWTSSDGFTAHSSFTSQIVGNGDAQRGLYTSIVSEETENMVLNTGAHADADGYLFDCSSDDYGYVNAWIYSDYAQDAGIILTLNTGTTYARYGINQLNWKGWKLVSFALNTAKGTLGNVTGVEIEVNKRKSDKLANLLSESTIAFGIDGIWVSETSAQAEWEAANSISADKAVSSSASDYYSIDFNDVNSLIVSGTANSASVSQNSSINRYNNDIYCTSARLSFKSLPYASLSSIAADNNTYKRKNFADNAAILELKQASLTDTIIIGDDAYLNAWVYNPEPKYTFDGTTPADIVIALGVKSGSNHSYTFVAFPANWYGWKLISIPVTEYYGSFDTKDITHIFIATNFGRLPVVTYDKDGDGTKEAYPAIADSKEFKKLSSTVHQNVFTLESSCTVAGKAVTAVSTDYPKAYTNTYAYIDVERFWISSGPVTEDIALTYAGGPELRCSENEGKNVPLFTAEENVISSSSVNAIKTINGVTSKATATYANGALTFDNFEYGATYYVNAEIIGTNGIKKHVDFTFTNEDIHVSDMNITDEKTATITMHGNLGTDYANARIIAAVYTTDACNELVTTYIGEADANGTVTVTIPAETDITGKGVRFFFFNNMNDIKPLEFDIQK